MGISHVTDKALFDEESTYGQEPGAYVADNFGQIVSFSYTEVENIEQQTPVGGGFVALRNEPKLYYVTGQLVTKVTKGSIMNLLMATLGDVTDDGTDYTATHSLDSHSYFIKAELTPTKIVRIGGLVFKNLSIEITKAGDMTFTMDYVAQKLDSITATITQTVNNESIFTGLDGAITWGGNPHVFNILTLTSDWNIADDEGRGVETVGVGSRRLIQRVVKHNLTVSGSVDMEIDDNADITYKDEKTDKTLIMTISRGTDNEHVFTMTGGLLNNKTQDFNRDNAVKNLTADLVGFNYSVTGDM